MSDEEAAKLASTNTAAASAVSALRMITEEMLNKTTNELTLVASEGGGGLKQEETEVFLSLLTTPFLAVPLLLEFFADGRARALQDPELQVGARLRH